MSEHLLEITRILKAPRSMIWRCWTEPQLLMQWFCPLPWTVTAVDMELRPGGRFNVTMQGPDGAGGALTGSFLALEPARRLVFTDALAEDWQPTAKAFMVGDLKLSDAADGGTHYHAMARHWTAEDMDGHKAMGFEQGWNAAADQLEALAARVAAQ